MRRSGRLLATAVALCCAALAARADAEEFVFTRLAWGDAGSRWRVDWPAAESHFLIGLDRLTSISVVAEGAHLRLEDDGLFDHPWLYAVEVGHMHLSDNEVLRLREYLLRGGFLMVDDFHGQAEWRQFESTMKRVFPDRPIESLSAQSALFQLHYDLAEREQIPGIRALLNGQSWEKGGRTPHWRGILDDHDRIMVAINFNQDIGDGWEHADEGVYPMRLTNQAYQLGINTVLYALTH